MYQIIDLSLPMEKNKGEPANYKIKQISHKKGGDIFGKNINGNRGDLSSKDFPNHEFLNLDIISASTHTGTHIDAPLHYGSMSEGIKARSIDEMPIEWFYGNGVILDFTWKESGQYINNKDIRKAESKINYKIGPNDIVLIHTGADKYWGTKEYITQFPGMDKSAVKELVNRGVHVIGTDAYSLDRPFCYMIQDYLKHRDRKQLFQAHFYGREKSYCQIERLTNLDKINRNYGFKVACFPIKITGAGAAWSRVAAIL